MAGSFDNEIRQAMSGGGGSANTTPAKSAGNVADRQSPPKTPAIQKPPAAPLGAHTPSNSKAVVHPSSSQNTPTNDPIIHAAGIAHAILNHGGGM